MDSRIAYTVDTDLALSYNNVYMIEAEAMDHELRATWTRQGVSTLLWFRSQANGVDFIKRRLQAEQRIRIRCFLRLLKLIHLAFS